MLKIIDTGKNLAQKNMDLDEELFDALNPNGPCILHFYEWEKQSASYGHFINPKKFIKNNDIHDLDLAKRPTGGGIIFHIWDFAFSILVPIKNKLFIPNTIDNYKLLNKSIVEAIKPLISQNVVLNHNEKTLSTNSLNKNFCMASLTKYDVIIKDKKIVGAAQRRKKNGLLYQVSIFLIKPNKDFLLKVLVDKSVVDAIMGKTYPILKTDDPDIIFNTKSFIKQRLVKEFKEINEKK